MSSAWMGPSSSTLVFVASQVVVLAFVVVAVEAVLLSVEGSPSFQQGSFVHLNASDLKDQYLLAEH